MKKLFIGLVVIVAIALVAVLGFAVDNKYRQYQNNKFEADRVAAEQKTAEIASIREASAAQVEKATAAYQNERLECLKGRAAYDVLTNSAKAQIPAPNCGPETIPE